MPKTSPLFNKIKGSDNISFNSIKKLIAYQMLIQSNPSETIILLDLRLLSKSPYIQLILKGFFHNLRILFQYFYNRIQFGVMKRSEKYLQCPLIQRRLCQLQLFQLQQQLYMTAQVINKEKVVQINSQYLQHQQHIQMQLKEGLQPITKEHIPLIKKILAKTFLERNDIWKSFALNIDQIQEFFERTVYLHLQCQEKARKILGPAFTTEWTFVKNGKITSSFHHFEIEVYRQVIIKSNAEEKLEVFKTLEKEGKKLTEGIDLYQYAPGTAVYMNFGGSNSQLHLGPLDVYHILNSYNLALKKCGVRWIVGRSSNMRATRHYIKVGGRVVKEISFERDGSKFPLYFFELDMENPKFLEAEKSYAQVEKKFLQLAKQQAKL